MTSYGSTQATNSRDAADWSRGRVIRMNLRAVFGRAYPRIIGLSREPSWLFFEIFLPFVIDLHFRKIYADKGQHDSEYRDQCKALRCFQPSHNQRQDARRRCESIDHKHGIALGKPQRDEPV